MNKFRFIASALLVFALALTAAPVLADQAVFPKTVQLPDGFPAEGIALRIGFFHLSGSVSAS
jgi:hypothetical protein